MGEASNETSFVIRDYFVVVILEELQLEVGQIETTVIICRELISIVYDDLVGISSCHKCVCHGLANFKNLLVARYQFIETKRGMRINCQMTDLILRHVHIDTLFKKQRVKDDQKRS